MHKRGPSSGINYLQRRAIDHEIRQRRRRLSVVAPLRARRGHAKCAPLGEQLRAGGDDEQEAPLGLGAAAGASLVHANSLRAEASQSGGLIQILR